VANHVLGMGWELPEKGNRRSNRGRDPHYASEVELFLFKHPFSN